MRKSAWVRTGQGNMLTKSSNLRHVATPCFFCSYPLCILRIYIYIYMYVIIFLNHSALQRSKTSWGKISCDLQKACCWLQGRPSWNRLFLLRCKTQMFMSIVVYWLQTFLSWGCGARTTCSNLDALEVNNMPKVSLVYLHSLFASFSTTNSGWHEGLFPKIVLVIACVFFWFCWRLQIAWYFAPTRFWSLKCTVVYLETAIFEMLHKMPAHKKSMTSVIHKRHVFEWI